MRGSILSYDIRETHFRDIYGKFLWSEPPKTNFRMNQVGESFYREGEQFRVARVAIAESIEHVNLEHHPEGIIIQDPHL